MKMGFYFYNLKMMCALSLSIAVLFPWRVSASQYKMIDLGTLGGNSSYAQAVNDSNQVAGRLDNSDGFTRTFLWNNGTMTELPVIEEDTGTLGYGINSSGEVVGSAAIKQENQWGGMDILFHAALWNNDGVKDLGTLGGNESIALGIDFFGKVVGKAQNSDGNHHAFLWQEDEMTDLGVLPGGNESCANAINALQHVAGYSANSDGNYRAFLWNNNDGMTDLGTLPGGNESRANALNNSGQTVGYSSNSDGHSHAVLWNNTEIQDFGTLGGDSSQAYGINDAGHVVGKSKNSDGDQVAFLWKANQMIDLNTLIVPGSKWILTEAKDINSSGAIAVDASKDSTVHAFLLMPEINQSFYGKITEDTLGYTMPVKDALISVINNETDAELTGYTDENGDFLISDLPVGTYTVSITADNFKGKTLKDVLVSEGADLDVSGSLALKMPLAGDANGNDKLDISDAIYDLQTISGIRDN